MLIDKTRFPKSRIACRPRATQTSFWQCSAGVAAAEAVLLALVFIGLSLMVAKILKPAIQTAARNLNQELAGGANR
jgi:hypothetical protein